MGFLSFFGTIKFTDEKIQDEFFQKCLFDIQYSFKCLKIFAAFQLRIQDSHAYTDSSSGTSS
jgi:hypothetical protein